jgi:formylglycine-generating enzyme required for sulfatase activity
VNVPSDGLTPFEAECPSTRAPVDVGESWQDVTPDGVRDLGGNVGEWTETTYAAISSSDADAGADVSPYVTRGGSFANSRGARTSIRSRQQAMGAGINGGFRCAASLPSR